MPSDANVAVKTQHLSIVGSESPAVIPKSSEVFAFDPSLSLVWMPRFRPIPEPVKHVIIRFAEDFACNRGSIIIAPSANYWIEHINHFLLSRGNF
jgi:hypothetical protein